MLHKQKIAFSLIELLVIISIIIILMVLTVGVARLISSRSKELKTKNILSYIEQALIIYKSHTGTYPVINSTTDNDQAKLFDVLTQSDMEIKDFMQNTVKIIDKPILEANDLINDKLVLQNELAPTQYHFIDAWGNRIIYLYGTVSDNSYSYYNDRHFNSDNSTYYNVNWPILFDIISYGKDNTSTTSSTSSRKDDITNFN